VVQDVITKKRGGKDYRLDATLNLDEFTKIILLSVLKYNQFHQISNYDRDIDLPHDLPAVPMALWNWGIQHRTGNYEQLLIRLFMSHYYLEKRPLYQIEV
jgi:hypothetical protein